MKPITSTTDDSSLKSFTANSQPPKNGAPESAPGTAPEMRSRVKPDSPLQAPNNLNVEEAQGNATESGNSATVSGRTIHADESHSVQKPADPPLTPEVINERMKQAVIKGDLVQLKQLIEKHGGDIDHYYDKGSRLDKGCLIHFAMENDRIDICQWLIDNGAYGFYKTMATVNPH